MKNNFILLFIVVFFAPFVSNAQPSEVVAKEFIDLLGKGKAGDAYQMADSSLQKQVTPVMFGLVWNQLETKYGKWNAQKQLRVDTSAPYLVHVIDNDFEKAVLTLNVVVNDKRKIAGFTIAKVTEKKASQVPLPENVREEALTVAIADEGKIHGTLTIPTTNIRPMPVALIIAGSGPTDRNGNNMLGVNAESYRMLAYRLAENGIASYRYDKRYIGESNAFKKASMLATVEDFANDALACINALKANKNFDQVFVIGHSEGALLGAIVAGKEPISGYISLCGAGEPLDKVIESQIKTVMPDSYAEALVLIGDVKKSPVLPTKISEPLRSIFNDNNVVFIHSLFKYTPTSLVKAIKVPVLIVAGTNDLQIRQNDAHILNKANLKSKLVIIDSMNHVLKNAGKDVAENLKTYEDASLPINDILIQELTLFINEQRKEKKQ